MRLPVVDRHGRTLDVLDLRPSKIVAIGQNYRAHAGEMGKGIPDEPLMFFKPPSALLAAGEAIERPLGFERVDFEGELVVVIGQRARRVPRAEAHRVILGYTCGNDITVRELQKKDGQYARAKGFDTFFPLGPVIARDLDPAGAFLTTTVNGTERQRSSTADLIFDVPTLIEFVTTYMTLEPGDLISTGTPAGVGPLQVGDVVEVSIAGIGRLHNPVIARA